jgi:hypothetical protein
MATAAVAARRRATFVSGIGFAFDLLSNNARRRVPLKMLEPAGVYG